MAEVRPRVQDRAQETTTGSQPPCLNFSAADRAHLARFLIHPIEHYTSLNDLRQEIGAMTTDVYVPLGTGLTRATHRRRIRRLAYNRRHQRNLRILQETRDELTRQMHAARFAASTLRREVNRLRDVNNQSQETVTQLRQINSVLLRFCHSRLQQQSATTDGLDTQLRRRVGEHPQKTPQTSPPRAR